MTPKKTGCNKTPFSLELSNAKIRVQQLRALADEMVAWMQVPENWWLKDFCNEKGLLYDEILEKYPNDLDYFKRSLSYCLQIQEVKTVKKTMAGDIPQTFAIFVSKNILGYRDRQESDEKKLKQKKIFTKEDALGKLDRMFPKRAKTKTQVGK